MHFHQSQFSCYEQEGLSSLKVSVLLTNALYKLCLQRVKELLSNLN